MSTTRIIAITAGTVLAVGAAYIVYFDYKRRTDPQFRRQLRRGRRQVEKQRAREQRDQVEASKKDYRKIWLEIKEFEFPIRPEDREQFFLSEISKGEQLINQGPSQYLAAARHFYRALKVYPNTPELLDIYKKTVPDIEFDMITGIKEAEDSEKKNEDSPEMD